MGQSGSASDQSNIMIVPLLLLGFAASSPVDRHARQTSMVLVRAGEGQRLESRQSNTVEDIKVPAGEAVDIFYRYGFFSLSVRVVPRDDHGSWLIREPTTKVFTEDFGSHYIRSLTVGDAVYQILALDRSKYMRARQEVLVDKKVTDFNQIYEQFLAPWMVKESGAVQAASGDPRVKALLDTRAVTKTQFSSYPSIFEIRKNARLLDELEFLTDGTQAITALSFRSIGALLPSVQAQDYYNEIVNTQLALWEVNI